MWGKIIESGIVALFFGLVTSISGIIITNYYNKKRAQKEKKYILTNEVYQRLVSIYNGELEKNDDERIEGSNINELVTNVCIQSYQKSIEKCKKLKNSYLKIKYILNKKMVKKLDLKFHKTEEIEKKVSDLEFENLYCQIQHIDNVNDDYNKIKEYRRRYIDEIKDLESIFLSVLEKQLRQLLK